MNESRSLLEAATPPGWPTKKLSGLLGFFRDRGVPFLRNADDTALRTTAINLRTAARRTFAGPLRPLARTEPSDAAFRQLGDADEVTLLTDNRESFLAKCAAIEAAEQTIDCALYYLADDQTGARFAELLARAAARGVRVRVGADAHASSEKQFGSFGYAATPTRGSLALLDKLQAAGCETRLLGDDHWSMHRKFLFVDRRAIIIGGRNVADHYAEPGWRDLELAFRGPFAEAFASSVESTFAAPAEAPPEVRGVVPGIPGHGGVAFTRAVTKLIAEAKRSIDIEHAYLLSHPWLIDGLRDAVSRGVRARAFTNSGASNDLAFMNWRLATTVRSLMNAGVEVFRRTTESATLHTKLIIADERRVVFGSTNLDYYSPTYCAELDIAVESEQLGARLTAVLEAGLAEPTTEAVLPGTPAASELERECNPWSVSRVCDLVIHDMQ